jgi:neutral ceramidase
MVGTPCDFSGELVKPIENESKNKNINLMINSFNGCYIGYITNDKWYDKTDINTYETYTMNWFGPYNGQYISELIKKIISINENH